MLTWKSSQILALGIVMILAGATAAAQQTVYKWVDNDGVIHFSDEPPADSDAVNVEIKTTDRAPTYVPAAQPVSKPTAKSNAGGAGQSALPAAETPSQVKKVDIASMSLPELDRRCDDARETRIAPMRDAEIATCKQDDRNDPAWCERFNADFGDGGRNANGTIRPRMFDDLPECVDALQERNRRGR